MKGMKPYAELVTQAEAATRAIKDPELRRVAWNAPGNLIQVL